MHWIIGSQWIKKSGVQNGHKLLLLLGHNNNFNKWQYAVIHERYNGMNIYKFIPPVWLTLAGEGALMLHCKISGLFIFSSNVLWPTSQSLASLPIFGGMLPILFLLCCLGRASRFHLHKTGIWLLWGTLVRLHAYKFEHQPVLVGWIMRDFRSTQKRLWCDCNLLAF